MNAELRGHVPVLLAEREVKPLAKEMDAVQDPKEAWNWELHEKANRLGFNKMLIPELSVDGLDSSFKMPSTYR